MTFPATIKVGSLLVGAGQIPVLAPEIGTYFTGDIALAEKIVRDLAAAGVKLIKGEVFLTADIALDVDFPYTYQTLSGSRTERYRDIVARRVLPKSAWQQLYSVIREAGLPSVVSAYDVETVEFLADLNVEAIKIASNNLVHAPLLRSAAATGKPVVIDTGKAGFDDVARAVDILSKAGCMELLINHNPDGHPAPASQHNLRIIETYRRAFGCPIGLSDHYVGSDMLLVAVGCGYDFLEKPVLHDLALEDVDTPWAIAIDKVAELVTALDAAARALGQPRRPERYTDKDHAARMGIVARRDLSAGERITTDTVTFAWPALGIGVRHWDLVEGWVLKADIKARTPIAWSAIQPSE